MATCVEVYFIHISSGIFVIGYVGIEHAYHLMSALKMYYENITTNWKGKLYYGITMKWNYTKRCVDISMLIYIKEALHQFGHMTPKYPHHQPYPVPERTYVADSQKMKPLDTSSSLSTD